MSPQARPLGLILLVLSAVALLCAIWTQYHWQMVATAVLLLFVGAAILGNVKPPRGTDTPTDRR